MTRTSGEDRERPPVDSSLWRKLVRWLSGQGRTREDSEDFVQSAFLRMEEQLRRGTEVREQEAFLKHTIRNLMVDSYRKTRFGSMVEEPVEDLAIESDAPTPADVFEGDEFLRRICEHLDQYVGKVTCQIYVYNRVYGYTYDDIAELTGKSPRTVEKHIARAVAVLVELRKRGDPA